MVTLKYQDCGSKLCVYIDGDTHEDVQDTFNSFWNHMATNGELDWVSEFSGCFWTDRVRLMRSFENRHMATMLNDADRLRECDPEGWAHCVKGLKGGFMPRAREWAYKQWEAMTLIDRPNFRTDDRVYSVGSVKGETAEA